MTKQEVAHDYLSFLEKDEIAKVIGLFTEDGIVVSPLYGTQSAKTFYKQLSEDTDSSKLKFDGLFFEKDSNRISLLFDYHWELKDGENVDFKVVDIIELNSKNKIEKLTIIYDTVEARVLLGK
ncbi:nuclear transport factor 2 family protein [Aquimarina sp. MMG016]|uniref:nuclear transport factor 2 family protein n=1 Tax=Aquimarina sp. MMG016 TaxID=2822690 RepID=UPI001B3A1810|nr:nuclear transport factor 2 family protein [Aquimarina sp. MMG016]MBQ4819142.1 nuclear transport factor 2 family protein [Aquimarina sp. MMG016]